MTRELSLTKSELIARLAERYPALTAKDAEFAVRTILDAMTSTLAGGQRIEIRGFGSFALSYRPPRVGRNPKSGERVLVPEGRVVMKAPRHELGGPHVDRQRQHRQDDERDHRAAAHAGVRPGGAAAAGVRGCHRQGSPSGIDPVRRTASRDGRRRCPSSA